MRHDRPSFQGRERIPLTRPSFKEYIHVIMGRWPGAGRSPSPRALIAATRLSFCDERDTLRLELTEEDSRDLDQAARCCLARPSMPACASGENGRENGCACL